MPDMPDQEQALDELFGESVQHPDGWHVDCLLPPEERGKSKEYRRRNGHMVRYVGETPALKEGVLSEPASAALPVAPRPPSATPLPPAITARI